MISKGKTGNEQQVEYVVMEQLVPKDHMLRKIEAALDFEFIYDLVEDKYSRETGRPSIDPVVLIKIVMIQYLFGIRSMRQTVKDIEVNAAYRWFLGMGWQDSVPHFTTFGKNYSRRFAGTDLFERIFAHILEACYAQGFVRDEAVFVDATHIKASANRNKKIKVQAEKEAAHCAAELAAEIAADREAHGKKPLKEHDDDDSPPPTHEVTQSTTDPESGMFVKGEHEKNFAYMAQTACDKHGFVLGYEVAPGNVHDSVSFWTLYEKIKDIHPMYLAADAAYKPPAILRQLFEGGIIPAVPYTRPKTKDGYLSKQAYRYEHTLDCYICPGGDILTYSTTNRDGYREYKSKGKCCKDCLCLNQCTHSKNHMKTITRHVWQAYVDTAEELRRDKDVHAIYKKRKETIERVFADAKEKHGMRYTQYRGLAKVKMQVGLTFACMNLKKLAMWRWNEPRKLPLFDHIFIFGLLFRKNQILAFA